jgi:hypothetical protein
MRKKVVRVGVAGAWTSKRVGVAHVLCGHVEHLP